MNAQSAGSILSEIAELDIVAVTRRDADGETLIRELQRTRARLRHVWPPADQLPADTDVIFCELFPGLPARIPWIPGDPKAALVLLLPPDPDLDLMKNCAPDAVLHRPFTASSISTSLVLARTNFAYGKRLRRRIDKLDETLRAIRCVERAKSILMARENIREDQAYDLLRRRAMDRRVSISAIAAAIVDRHEILG